jgi:hypothetical protein
MSTDVNTPDTSPEGVDVAPADGKGADNASMSLEDINSLLGKDFKDIETAKKSIKDTQNFVGARNEFSDAFKQAKDIVGGEDAEVVGAVKRFLESGKPAETKTQTKKDPEKGNLEVPEGFIPKDQYEEDRFFDKNGQYEKIKAVIKPIKQANPDYQDMPWEDFVQTDQIKEIHDTYAGFDELKGERSVLESNPKLGAVTDNLTKARDASKEAAKAAMAGDVTESNQLQQQAKSSALKGVIEAYDLDQ